MRIRPLVVSFLCIIGTYFPLSVSPAIAQTTLQLEKTDNPRNYVKSLLEDVSENGTAPLRSWLSKLGLGAAQVDGIALSLDAGLEKKEPHTIKIIEEIDNGGVLRQVYAYSHFGHNAWMFWRLDFVKTGNDWTVSGFSFDSEYKNIMATEFETAVVVE